MRSILLGVFVFIAATMAGEAPTPVQSPATRVTAPECGAAASAFTRTTLYFGMSKKSGGTVSSRDWAGFLKKIVTPRFPQGFTVWDASGQRRYADGRIESEKSKVLSVVHEDDATVRAKVAEMIDYYKRALDQEAVLWETSRVCASF